MCGFHSLVRTLQKQPQKAGETLELFLLLLKASDSWLPTYLFKKGCYWRGSAKTQIWGFLLGLWDSLLYWSVCRCADLWTTLPPTVSDIRSARVAERSMEQLREPAGKGKEQWIVRDKEIKSKRKWFVELNSNEEGTEELTSPFRRATLSPPQNPGPSGAF